MLYRPFVGQAIEENLEKWRRENREQSYLPQLPCAGGAALQKFERFVVTAAIKIVRKPRIDWFRQARPQILDSIGNLFQPRDVLRFVAAAFFILNYREAFSQSIRKIGSHIFHRINQEWTRIDTNNEKLSVAQRGPVSERSCRLASSQSESASPGSANLRRRSEMK